jgi:hypothetical protein
MIAQAIRAILLATATAPGVLNNGCCTGHPQKYPWVMRLLAKKPAKLVDDKQPSKIAISLLGDAAEPLLATRRVLPSPTV